MITRPEGLTIYFSNSTAADAGKSFFPSSRSCSRGSVLGALRAPRVCLKSTSEVMHVPNAFLVFSTGLATADAISAHTSGKADRVPRRPM